MSERQMGFTVFAGLAAPMALLCAATAWPAVLLGLSVAVLGVQLGGRGGRMPQWLRGVHFIWCALLLAKAASMSRVCFQDMTGVVPVVLLALAAVAGREGVELPGRLGALLWPAVAVLTVALLAFSTADFRWERFASAGGNAEGWVPVAALGLSPLALRDGQISTEQGRGICWGCWMAAALGLGSSAVCCGVLGKLQTVLQQPLTDMVRGVSVLGIAERLEALLSTALCIGFFVGLCALCAVGNGYMQAERRRPGWWVAIAALALSGTVDLLPDAIWFGLNAGLGVIVPLLQDKGTFEKNRGISKNNA